MKYTYKKVLKILIKEYYQNHCTCDTNWDICKLHNTRNDIEKSFDILCAKDLIKLQLFDDNTIASLSIKDNGITFFIDRRRDLILFLIPTITAIISLIVSIVALCTSSIPTPLPVEILQSLQ